MEVNVEAKVEMKMKSVDEVIVVAKKKALKGEANGSGMWKRRWNECGGAKRWH